MVTAIVWDGSIVSFHEAGTPVSAARVRANTRCPEAVVVLECPKLGPLFDSDPLPVGIVFAEYHVRVSPLAQVELPAGLIVVPHSSPHMAQTPLPGGGITVECFVRVIPRRPLLADQWGEVPTAPQEREKENKEPEPRERSVRIYYTI